VPEVPYMGTLWLCSNADVEILIAATINMIILRNVTRCISTEVNRSFGKNYWLDITNGDSYILDKGKLNYANVT
jgi:hypothetical protein